jgi:hypothetical protein
MDAAAVDLAGAALAGAVPASTATASTMPNAARSMHSSCTGSKPAETGSRKWRRLCHPLGMHFVCIFGPPAVGKMTVGHELAKLTGYKLFHNHMTIEPFLGIFEFGSPAFNRLSSEFRRRVLEEAVESELPGLIFTYVWGLELAGERDFMARNVALMEGAGGRVSFVELAAPLDVRLARNGTEFRLDHKRSKRNRKFSDANVVKLETYTMNTGEQPTVAEELFTGREHLRIENTDLPAADAAALIVEKLGLTGLPGS